MRMIFYFIENPQGVAIEINLVVRPQTVLYLANRMRNELHTVLNLVEFVLKNGLQSLDDFVLKKSATDILLVESQTVDN